MSTCTNVKLVACAACAKLKVSCDRKNPCSRCTKRNIHCEIRLYRRSRKNTGSKNVSVNDDAAVGLTSTIPEPTGMSVPSDLNLSQHTEPLLDPLQFNVEDTTMMDDLNFAFDGHTTLNPFMYLDNQDFNKFIGDSSLMHGFLDSTQLTGFDATQQFSLPVPESSVSPQSPIGNHDVTFQSPSTISRQTPRSRQTSSSASQIAEYFIPPLTDGLPTSNFPKTSCQPQSAMSSKKPALPSLDTVSTSHTTRKDSSSSSKVPTLTEDIAVQTSFDLWSLYRCNPPDQSQLSAKPADVYLGGLSRLGSANHDSDTEIVERSPERLFGTLSAVSKITNHTRDQLLAIMQNLFRRAFELNTNTGGSMMSHNTSQPLVMLPSSAVLEQYLRLYRGSVERFYPLRHEEPLEPNNATDNDDSGLFSFQLLLMVALGSSSVATSQARCLSGGLTEACRTSFTDIFETDTSDQVSLARIALLFTILAAWSGDHSHMSFANARIGLFLCTLGQLHMYEEPVFVLPSRDDEIDPEHAWILWNEHQSKLKLVYSWVKVDLEFSIFHDSVPMIPVSEVTAPMPSPASLSTACSAEDWRVQYESQYPDGSARVPSLASLFKTLIEHDQNQESLKLTPMQLGLLLHPLQVLVHGLRQLRSSFSEHKSSRRVARAITTSNVLSRLEEVQTLLSQWYTIFSQHQASQGTSGEDSSQHDEALIQADLVLYHLTYLKTITDFKEIEQRARTENQSTTDWSSDRLVQDPEEAWQHCCSVLKILEAFPRRSRPPWWPAAVYRVAMIALTVAMSHAQSSPVQTRSPDIDILRTPLRRQSTIENHGQSLPQITKADGGSVTWDDATGILNLHIGLLQDDERRFSFAIRSKILRLRDRLDL